MMKKLVAIAALAAALAAPVALADHHGKKSFADLDADASGGLTLIEVQAVKPEFTAEKFAKYDTDASGEISQAEYDAWKAAKKDKAKDKDKTGY
jgi:opacity protein-like surface antigen